jgi:hypothetical protein
VRDTSRWGLRLPRGRWALHYHFHWKSLGFPEGLSLTRSLAMEGATP